MLLFWGCAHRGWDSEIRFLSPCSRRRRLPHSKPGPEPDLTTALALPGTCREEGWGVEGHAGLSGDGMGLAEI